MGVTEVNEMLRGTAGETLTEASEVKFEQLPKDVQKKIRKIEKFVPTPSKAFQFFKGIHGVVAMYKMTYLKSPRFGSDTLKKFVGLGIRWLESGGNGEFSVGL